jgi:hypothetical protein
MAKWVNLYTVPNDSNENYDGLIAFPVTEIKRALKIATPRSRIFIDAQGLHVDDMVFAGVPWGEGQDLELPESCYRFIDAEGFEVETTIQKIGLFVPFLLDLLKGAPKTDVKMMLSGEKMSEDRENNYVHPVLFQFYGADNGVYFAKLMPKVIIDKV